MHTNGNARRLAVVAACLTMLSASGLAAAGGPNGTKPHCDAGRGNGAEFSFTGGTTVDGVPNDCDPGNSGAHNHGGDVAPPLF
jgi:hypothetical protein